MAGAFPAGAGILPARTEKVKPGWTILISVVEDISLGRKTKISVKKRARLR